ncbi:DVU_1551 family NTP transferase [Acetonema longum]|uniref:HD domain-containing protein n=1 Tax=Acetonema longum DSM 6540 TaxID=1009370 RepID=F7NEC8_9FIRM|nr:NTP transferase domain-containing protein [Acetonema longum]EGO65640.1 hypothetical protein ALO_01954 [Acetonema longum DSM 6540]
MSSFGERENIAALILAAGYSSRAPQFKPLLPLGDSTVIEQVIRNFRRAGIKDITVVAGHRAGELIPVLERARVRWVVNEQYSQGMYSSVVSGVKTLAAATQACFLLPGDMPLVKSHTLKVLCRTYRKLSPYVCYPVIQGERGHPPLLSSRLFPEILAWQGQGGLRPLLARYEAWAEEAEVQDGGIAADLDTGEDYENICRLFARREAPALAECEAILRKRAAPEPVVRHSRLVSAVAWRLADSLNQAGLGLNLELVAAAGLLHDLAKGKPDHARYGANILRRLGYPKVAAIVAVHGDIAFEEESPLDEAAVVYLADKLVQGDRIVSVDERFRPSLQRFAADEAVLPLIEKRRSTAQRIGAKAELLLGADLATVCPAGAGKEGIR